MINTNHTEELWNQRFQLSLNPNSAAYQIVWLWGNGLTSLYLSFLMCKIRKYKELTVKHTVSSLYCEFCTCRFNQPQIENMFRSKVSCIHGCGNLRYRGPTVYICNLEQRLSYTKYFIKIADNIIFIIFSFSFIYLDFLLALEMVLLFIFKRNLVLIFLLSLNINILKQLR